MSFALYNAYDIPFLYNKITLLLLLSYSYLNGQSSDIEIIRVRVYQSILAHNSVKEKAYANGY